MRRVIAVILVLFVPLVSLTFIARDAAGRGMPQPARALLDQYLSGPYGGGPGWQITRIETAWRPWRFQAEASGYTFGTSNFYDTTYNPSLAALIKTRPTPPVGGFPTDLSYIGHPLPYPPREIWCVLLRMGESQTVVLVALHEDLYKGDWIIHEMPQPGSRDPQAVLAEVGCQPEVAH